MSEGLPWRGWPRCARCDKPVDRFSRSFDARRGRQGVWLLAVSCHGEAEAVEVPDELVDLEGSLNVGGDAFVSAAPRLSEGARHKGLSKGEETMSQGELSCMDHTGDTKIIWDSDNADEVAAARRTFDDLKRKGFAAYSVKGRDGEKNEVVREFDPGAERIIMAPPMVGG